MTDLFEANKPKDEGTKPEDKSGEGVKEGSVDTYLGLILNDEGKQKYATAEEALKGSIHAQSHIKTLEDELKTLREKDDKDEGMSKILEALKDKGKPDEKTSQGITEEQLADVVTQLLDKRESVSTREQNIATVIGKFNTLYGEKASETLYGKAKDLGFSKDEINGMIATNPTATLKVLGVDGDKQQKADPTSSDLGVNTDGFQKKGEEQTISSMGYVSGKQLQSNWEANRAATYKKLGVEIPS